MPDNALVITTLLKNCEAALLEANAQALRDARRAIAGITDTSYVQPAPRTNGLRLGTHLRHVIEFVECFLQGLDSGLIDYDTRPRDTLMEGSRTAGLHALDRVIARLEAMPRMRADLPVRVRAEDSRPGDVLLCSSLARETQAVLSHSVHHFAIIAIAIAAHGQAVDPRFGVAPATLRHRALAAKAEAA